MLVGFLIILVLAFVVWNLYNQYTWSKDLDLEFHFDEEYTYQGQTSKITTCVENKKRMPIPILEVRFQLKKGIVFPDNENSSVSDNVYKRDIYAMRGYERVRRTIPIQCMKRGYYDLNKIEVRAISTFFEANYHMERPMHSEMYVYAKRVPVKDILAKSQRMLGNMQMSKQLFEDPFAFRSIREYNINDPMKTINWKASAKTGELMVNTFDSTMTQKAMIFLDLTDNTIMRHENLVEESISVAATLCQRLMRSGMEVGIALNTKDAFILPPGNRVEDLTLIERRLAMLDSKEDLVSYAEILLPIESDVFPFFLSHNGAAEEAIREYLGKDGQGIWVRPVSPSEEIDFLQGSLQMIARKVW